jgi:predicted nucleotidyltransferase
MLDFYAISDKNGDPKEALGEGEKLSVYYHDIFDYPLTFADLIKWNVGSAYRTSKRNLSVVCKNGYFVLKKKEGMVYKRALRERISSQKMEIAKNAAKVLSRLQGIKMIGVTGSLAMANSGEESDIDFLIITKSGHLWSTRLFAYIVISLFGFSARRSNDSSQKDKLCLNMWMDESDLIWRNPRNIYTAHEIAQIVPLVNKKETYEEFLSKNRWILKYWPNSVKIKSPKLRTRKMHSRQNIFEILAFRFQYLHMKGKLTREIITRTRAIFHPNDWGKVVLSRLST